jgi:DNA-binding NtrC family response regulator
MGSVPVHNHGRGQECTILVVDEDEAMRALLVDALQENGCRVVEASDGKGAFNALQTAMPNVIVTELKIPDGGYSYLQALKVTAPQSAIVVMTAHGDSQSKGKALECGAKGYFEKPLHIKDLQSWLCQMCLVNPCGNIL